MSKVQQRLRFRFWNITAIFRYHQRMIPMLPSMTNPAGDREKAQDVILSNELLLIQHLRYHLTVHNPYRSVEGLLIDSKTRMQHIIKVITEDDLRIVTTL